jgi:phosphate transport system substrate-binding protein
MKKILILAAILIGALAFTACGSDDDNGNGTTTGSSWDASRQVNVIARDPGSGTHAAFIELLGIEVSADGNVTDNTYIGAYIAPSTGGVITTVAGDEFAIGYISMGAMNTSVRALSVDGIAATVENVQNGTYPVFRSFYMAVQPVLSPEAAAFLAFIQSAEGQDVIAGRNYVPAFASPAAFVAPEGLSGTVVAAGSTSMTDITQRLAEAFEAVVPGVSVEVHSSGSGAGITAAIDGIADIGLTSRAIRDGELEQGVISETMAHDGIVVVVNNSSPVTALTSSQIHDIFVRDVTRWNEVYN